MGKSERFDQNFRSGFQKLLIRDFHFCRPGHERVYTKVPALRRFSRLKRAVTPVEQSERYVARAHDSAHRPKVEVGGTLPNFSTVIGPFLGRITEVEPNEDARIRILGCRLGEAGI